MLKYTRLVENKICICDFAPTPEKHEKYRNSPKPHGKGSETTLLIPQVRLALKYPISPWEMIHLPVVDNALCVPSYTVYTAVSNKSLTATYQYKISNPSNKVLVNNN
jgi:hypothetical protein